MFTCNSLMVNEKEKLLYTLLYKERVKDKISFIHSIQKEQSHY